MLKGFRTLTSRLFGKRAAVAEINALEAKSSTQDRSKLVLFVHGLTGAKATTFERFLDILRADPEIAPNWDVEEFGFSTALHAASASPDPATVARMMATEIEHAFGRHRYDEVAIIAHSLGGLIVRRYLANMLAERPEQLRVSRVVYYATPHLGTVAASLANVAAGTIGAAVGAVAEWALACIPLGKQLAGGVGAIAGLGPSEQLAALGFDSAFLRQLATDEAIIGKNPSTLDRVWSRYVLAEADRWVAPSSAWGPHGPTDYEVVAGTDHASLVKPDGRFS